MMNPYTITPLLSTHTVLRAVVYIEDGLAYKSLYHRHDWLALRMYRFMQTWLYRIIYGIVVGVMMLLAVVETPSSLSFSSDFVLMNNTLDRYELPYGITHTIEFVCIIAFVMDFSCRCWLSEMPLRKNKWMVAYGTINLLHFALFWVYIGTSYTPLRVYRIFRPFYMIQHSSIMKKMLKAIKRSLPEVFGVLVVLFLNIFMFSLAGLIIFSDIKGDDNFDTITNSMWSLLVLITTANNPDVMIPTYRNNRLYVFFFLIFIWLGTYGLMNLLLAVIYNQFRLHFKVSVRDMVLRRQVALRAAFEVLTQSIERKPERSFSESIRISEEQTDSDDDLIVDDDHYDDADQDFTPGNLPKNRPSFIEIATICGVIDLIRMHAHYKNYLVKQIEDNPRIITDYLDKQDFIRLFLDIETDYSEWKQREDALSPRPTGIHPLLSKLVNHPIFEVVGTLLAVINTIALLIVLAEPSYAEVGKAKPGAQAVIDMNIVVTIYYAFEQVLRLAGRGIKVYFTTFSYCWDCVITVLMITLMAVLYTTDQDYQEDKMKSQTLTNILRVINLCICLRIVRVVSQVKRLRNVLQTYLTLIKQMQVYLGILISLMYIFAILGMELFSPDVTAAIHNQSALDKHNQSLAETCGSYWNLNYYSLNFDDFFAAVITLFTLMVVNNWHVIVNAFSYSRDQWWVMTYFISWWVVCVLLVLNVIIALILDAFIDRFQNREETPTVSNINFHVNQFVEASERTRPVSENELISVLHKTHILKNKFVNVHGGLPSSSSHGRNSVNSSSRDVIVNPVTSSSLGADQVTSQPESRSPTILAAVQE